MFKNVLNLIKAVSDSSRLSIEQLEKWAKFDKEHPSMKEGVSRSLVRDYESKSRESFASFLPTLLVDLHLLLIFELLDTV